MSESEPNQEKSPELPKGESESPVENVSRRRTLTPEQRRILNTPKTSRPNEPLAAEKSKVPPASIVEQKPETSIPRAENEPVPTESIGERRSAATNRQPNVVAQATGSRAIEMRSAIVVLSVLVLLGAVFFAGRKFDAIRYHLMTTLNPPKIEAGPDKYPGISSEELIETGIAAERAGKWQEAADRFISAKRKDHSIPGLLFRIGKGAFDRNDLPSADAGFERSIQFGENLAVANYYRGLIALRRHDFGVASRFFEAASKAEPFAYEFPYFWGEALRLDHHPREAIHRYQQSMERAPRKLDVSICQFKIRLARIESVEGDKVRAELQDQRNAGPLSVDWILTDAALQIQAGEMSEAARLITQARARVSEGLFTTCVGDVIFVLAANDHPEIASAINPPTAPPEAK